MNLVDVSVKIRCDMPNCRNMSKCKLVKPGFLKGAGLFLCKDCLLDAYKAIGESIVPKSPNNMLNKRISNKKPIGEVNDK